MAEFRVVSARRGFDFVIDDVNLLMLSTPAVQSAMRESFGFSNVAVGQPPPTFGPVLPISGPGGVGLESGAATIDKHVIPIRFIYFEPTRVVIDIGAPSSFIDPVYQQVRKILDAFPSADNQPVLGKAMSVNDQSEISFRTTIDLSAAMPSGFLAIFMRYAPRLSPEVKWGASLALQPIRPSEAYGLQPVQFGIETRLGTTPDQQVLYSAAPLDTDRHKKFLIDLEHELAALPAARRSRSR
jgi:hypothetical protein